MRTDYTHEIAAAAAAHGFDPDLLEAQVLVESGGHPDAFRFEPGIWSQLQSGRLTLPPIPGPARRVASSYGLLQILYVTAAVDDGLTGDPEQLFMPTVGLAYGAKQLARLLAWARRHTADETRAMDAALAAYNGGEVGNLPTGPLRNQAYVDRVHHARAGLT